MKRKIAQIFFRIIAMIYDLSDSLFFSFSISLSPYRVPRASLVIRSYFLSSYFNLN